GASWLAWNRCPGRGLHSSSITSTSRCRHICTGSGWTRRSDSEMARYFVRMPRLGGSVNEGTIGHWLVKPSDRVTELEAIVEVTTDKVDAELPAPVSGILAEILADEGDVVTVGERIAVIDRDPETAAAR